MFMYIGDPTAVLSGSRSVSGERWIPCATGRSGGKSTVSRSSTSTIVDSVRLCM